MSGYEMLVVTDDIKQIVKKVRPAADESGWTSGHRPQIPRFSEVQTLVAILHWFATLPFELQQDLVTLCREEASA